MPALRTRDTSRCKSINSRFLTCASSPPDSTRSDHGRTSTSLPRDHLTDTARIRLPRLPQPFRQSLLFPIKLSLRTRPPHFHFALQPDHRFDTISPVPTSLRPTTLQPKFHPRFPQIIITHSLPQTPKIVMQQRFERTQAEEGRRGLHQASRKCVHPLPTEVL